MSLLMHFIIFITYAVTFLPIISPPTKNTNTYLPVTELVLYIKEYSEEMLSTLRLYICVRFLPEINFIR